MNVEEKRYSYQVYYPNEDSLVRAGFARVAHLPCILDSRLRYHRLASRFIQDRALGLWEPVNHGEVPRARPLADKSVRGIAFALANCLEWGEIRGVDFLTAEYVQDLLGRYQHEMLKGSWSATGKGLEASTINFRVGIGTQYCTWLADKKLRGPFVIPTEIRKLPPNGGRFGAPPKRDQYETRQGKVQVKKTRLAFPSEQDIGRWLHSAYSKPEVGSTVGLMAETVLDTALREAEICGLRIDTLPWEPSEWRVASRDVPLEQQMVLLDVRFGAKGPQYGTDHGDKIGPEKPFRIPMPLALKLHEYREKIRPKVLAKAIKKGRTLAAQQQIRDEAVQLFLNPKTGRKYTTSQFYDEWRRTPGCPKGWSPHKGRHWWACQTLWKRMEQQREAWLAAVGRGLEDTVRQSVHASVMSVIQIEIKSQLRHVSWETSMIYLQWVFDRLGIAHNVHDKYLQSIADDEDDSD